MDIFIFLLTCDSAVYEIKIMHEYFLYTCCLLLFLYLKYVHDHCNYHD